MWPDRLDAALELIEKGNISAIAFDTMAEMTLPGMQKLRHEDADKGYTDIRNTANNIMPPCRRNGITLISNCGGANPLAAARIAGEAARRMKLFGTRIAAIEGDDTTGAACLARIGELKKKGVSLRHLDSGEDLDAVADRIIAMSVYLGAEPISEALAQDAHVILTGRHTDTAMWLAPAQHAFGWSWSDWDRLAAGVIMGHLMECSGHVTGGNFSFWDTVPDPDRLGFPLAEVSENGEAVITKVDGSGGIVSEATCKEQLLYELHDPANFLSPDVIADVTGLRFVQEGKDRVRLTGVKGKPRPETLKACIAYQDGWIGEAFAFYAWPRALAKARRAEETLRQRYTRLGFAADEIRFDLIGVNALHGSLAPEPREEPNEVGLRVTVKAQREGAILQCIREVYAMALSGPAAETGVFHLPPREMIALWPTLIPREEVPHRISITEIFEGR